MVWSLVLSVVLSLVWQHYGNTHTQIMGGASEDVETLKEPDTVREVAKVLRTNVKVCAALGQPFIAQMGRIYLDMLNVYVLLCALCAVCCVLLCAVHCVLCAVCCVLCAVCCALCDVCCALCAVCCALCTV